MKLPWGAKLYIWAVVSLAAWVIYSVLQQFPIEFDASFLQTLVLFTLLSFLTQVYEIELVYGRHISTGLSIFLTAVLLGGPPLAVGVIFISTLFAEILLRHWSLRLSLADFLYRVGFNTSQIVLSAFSAAMVFLSLGGQPLIAAGNWTVSDFLFSWNFLPALGAFLTYSLMNTALVSSIISLTLQIDFTYHFRFNVKYIPVQILSLGVLGVLMAVLYALSPWNLLLALIPLGLVHLSLRNYMRLRHEAKKTFERVAQLLADRDPYTYEHSSGVAQLAEKIARTLKLPLDEIEKIRDAATIHDIGKLGVPDKILNKPGPLTEEEWAVMKKHPEIGASLLKDLEIFSEIIDIVLYEHERWDGSGYPKGLKGREIPLGARIIAVADVYNALVTDRPYRKAFSQEEALRMMREMRGVKLDPDVVDALFAVLGETPLESMAHPPKAMAL